MIQHTVTTTDTKRQTQHKAYIYSFADVPTGKGRNTEVPDLRKWRDEIGLPRQYRNTGAVIVDHKNNELYHQGPPPRLVPQAMSGLYAYMGLSGDRHVKAMNAAAMLYAIHPWVDGNGRVGRRLYRFYVPECTLSTFKLRRKIVRRLDSWDIRWNDLCEID